MAIGVKLGIDGEAEYRKQLQNIVQSTKTLDKQLGELQSSFTDETKSMEQNQKETELLQKKAELLNKEVEEMQKMVDIAAEKFGESSTECQKWEASLATAQTELNKTNNEIAAHQEAAEEANSALGQLTAEIDAQNTELDDLRNQYINAVLEFGSTSDEAEDLAGQITNLSGELQANQQALDEATAAADSLTGGFDEITGSEEGAAGAFEQMADKFIPGFDLMKSAAMGAGLADLISGVVDMAVELGTKIYETAIEWQEAMFDMEIATGLTGDELQDLMDKTTDLFLSFEESDASIGDISNAMKMLTTRLGMSSEETEALADYFMQYATVTKTDVTDAVNQVVDVMKQFGLVTDDTGKNIETAKQILDRFTQAQSDTNITTGQLASELKKNAGAFQSLGMSYEEAIGQIVAFVDAGGEASDISMALYNVVKNLGGKTDDLKGAWQDAVEIMSNSKDGFATLEQTIGDTGVTIEEAFGAKKAQTMINTFSNGKVAIDRFTASTKQSDGVVMQYFHDTRSASDKISLAWKQTAQSSGTDLNGLNTIVNLGKNTVKAFSDDGKTNLKSFENQSKTSFSNTSAAASNMDSNISGNFQGLKNSASSAANFVTGTLQRLQNQFNNTTLRVNLSAPEISYLQGGTSQHPSWVPQAGGRYTFARAYTDPIRLTAPTIFGSMNGNLLVGGDRQGAEIVVGENHLLNMFRSAVQGAGGQNINVVVNAAEGQSPNEIANYVINKLQMRLIESEASNA